MGASYSIHDGPSNRRMWQTDMASDPVNTVYSVLPKDFPLGVGECRRAISSLGEARVLHMIEMCGGKVREFGPGEVPWAPPDRGVMNIGEPPTGLSFAVVPGDSPAPFHHNAAVPGDVTLFYGERDKVLAEYLMHLCQERIAFRLEERDDRTSRLVRMYYSGDGYRTGSLHHVPWAYFTDHGISVRSTEVFRRMMYAVGCLRGDAFSTDRAKRVRIPQKNKPERLLARQERSVLNGYFSEVDLDSDMSMETLDSVERAFEREVAMGYVVPLRGSETAIRFRKIGDCGFGGCYYCDTRDIILSPDHPHHFSHEYGHAVYYAYRCWEDAGFKECYRRYASLIKADPAGPKYDNLEYYLRRTEAFARMYDRFMYLKTGDTVLNNLAESRVHPKDRLLDGMAEEYFTDLFDRLRTETAV